MIDLMDLTEGWLVDWREQGGRSKEWLRSLQMNASNHGWVYALRMEPVYLCRNVSRLLSWLPFLWDDRDWDHSHLWRVMRYKIGRMRRIQERQNHEDWKAVADQMASAELILTRLVDDEYAAEEFEEHHKRYGSALDRSGRDHEGLLVMLPHPDPACHDDLRAAFELEQARREADVGALGRLLQEHVWRWWD